MTASWSMVAVTAAAPEERCSETPLSMKKSLLFSRAVKYMAWAGPAPRAMAFMPLMGRKRPSSATMLRITVAMPTCWWRAQARDCIRVWNEGDMLV